MKNFAQRKSLLFGGVGFLVVLGVWVTGQSPEALLFTLSMVPLAGMAVASGATLGQASVSSNGTGRGSGSSGPPTSDALFWLMVSIDVVAKGFLGFWHLSVLSGALGSFGSEFGSLVGLGPAFDAMGMGSWTLGTILALAMTLVFLGTSPAAWYTYETKYTGPKFWETPSPDRLILMTIIGLYSALILFELIIIGQNIMAAAAIEQDAGPWGPLITEEDAPTSPLVQVGLSVLMTLLGVVVGWLSSRILIQIERG